MMKQNIDGVGMLYSGKPGEVMNDIFDSITAALSKDKIGMNGLSSIAMAMVLGNMIWNLKEDKPDLELVLRVVKEVAEGKSMSNEMADLLGDELERIVRAMGGQVVDPSQMPTLVPDDAKRKVN